MKILLVDLLVLLTTLSFCNFFWSKSVEKYNNLFGLELQKNKMRQKLPKLLKAGDCYI